MAKDERLQSNQLGQLRASTPSLNQSLAIARSSLDAAEPARPGLRPAERLLDPARPVVQQGERLGQIDSAGRNKLRADVDEFYLGRVAVGQTASTEVDGKTYRLRVSKIYPQVRNGQFEIDLVFVGPSRRRSSAARPCQTKLTLGDPAPAVLIPNGAFFNDTGGNWVFVVDARRHSAVKRRSSPARPPQRRLSSKCSTA